MKNLNNNNNNQETKALVLTLVQDAYPQADYRFGFDNPIHGWTATAVDDQGNRYDIWWKEKEEGTWDETDTGQACDWDNPNEVIRADGCVPIDVSNVIIR